MGGEGMGGGLAGEVVDGDLFLLGHGEDGGLRVQQGCWGWVVFLVVVLVWGECPVGGVEWERVISPWDCWVTRELRGGDAWGRKL